MMHWCFPFCGISNLFYLFILGGLLFLYVLSLVIMVRIQFHGICEGWCQWSEWLCEKVYMIFFLRNIFEIME